MQYPILFLSVINLLLGFIILIHSKNRENQTFLSFALFSSLWMFSNFFLRIYPNVLILRLSYGLGVIVATFGLLWSYTFLKKQLPVVARIFLLPVSILLFVITLTTNAVIGNLKSVGYLGFDGQLGRYFQLYSLYFCLVILSIIYALTKQLIAEKDAEKKSQIKYVLIGAIFFATISSIVSFVIPTFFHTLSYVSLDNFSFSVFFICIVFTILKHKLFNMKVIVTEIFVFLLWSSLLGRVVIFENLQNFVINTGLLGLTVIVGIFLIKSVLREVEQKEYIEKLAWDLEKSKNELESANIKLKELDRQKTEFVSIASHQLRSPLTAIKGYSSMLLEGSFGKLTAKPTDAVNRIFESSQKLVSIIEDFLNVTRIELGTMKYTMSEFDLAELAQNVTVEQKPSIMKRGLEITFSSDQGNHKIYADVGKVNQVINNVIDNAVKYTKDGSIAVSVSMVKVGDKDKVQIRVKDTGVGIDPETMPKLFQKFIRAVDAGQTNIIGTGLGLYVAKQIVEGLGGRIWAESEGKGKGSTFFVDFPISTGKEPVLPQNPTSEVAKQAPVTTTAKEALSVSAS